MMRPEPIEGVVAVYDHMRIGTADRERAADVLKAALAEGRLTKDEFEERLDGAMNRAQTYAELRRVIGDLPAGAEPYPTVQPVQPIQPTFAVQPYQPYYPVQKSTNGLAIGSLVCSLFWFFWVGSVVGVIFGHVSLAQIRRNHEEGTGLAVAGLVIGYLGLAMLMLLIILGISH